MTTSATLKLKTVKNPRQNTPTGFVDYLRREERSLVKHEFYNGKIITMPGAKAVHNQIGANIIWSFKNKLLPLEKQYIVYNSDQKIYIETENIALYPDALVICESPVFWKDREDIIVNPLLIVEILSRSTANYDRHEKFLLYENLPSFKEYILVEQTGIKVESWFRVETNTWNKTVCTDINASLYLRSVNVFVPLNEIYHQIKF